MKKRHLAEVTHLYPSNFRDPVQTLREIASAIESGKYGDVGCVAVALLGDTLEVFGLGKDSEGPTVHLMLCTAARRLEDTLMNVGGGDKLNDE